MQMAIWGCATLSCGMRANCAGAGKHRAHYDGTSQHGAAAAFTLRTAWLRVASVTPGALPRLRRSRACGRNRESSPPGGRDPGIFKSETQCAVQPHQEGALCSARSPVGERPRKNAKSCSHKRISDGAVVHRALLRQFKGQTRRSVPRAPAAVDLGPTASAPPGN